MKKNLEPFPHLSAGGRELAEKLQSSNLDNETLVLAIVSAGVPVAFEVAKHLNLSLDLLIIKRLLPPSGNGMHGCAVTVAGNLIIDQAIGPRPAISQKPFEYFVADALHRLTNRTELCRGNRAVLNPQGKKMLLVDCAIRTALTMQTAVAALRTFKPARIVVAIPVTSVDGLAVTAPLADDVIYLGAPEPFGNAGVWFRDFGRPKDEAISGLLNEISISSVGP
jgi:putative phosphoribosyl transferase